MKNKTHYLRKLTTWLLPYVCILCNDHTDTPDICSTCRQFLPILTDTCPRCARPLHAARLCSECIKQPPPFDCTFALFYYQAPITKWIIDLKFGHSLTIARILGEMLTQKICSAWYATVPLPEAIIPIPLHQQRIKERGFNQALEIARPLAKALHLQLIVSSCLRIKNTVAQATLPARERQQNIKDAFYIHKSLPYQHVAVIDDVITTGQTMIEFCATLKQAGIKRIDAWCCARPNFE